MSTEYQLQERLLRIPEVTIRIKLNGDVFDASPAFLEEEEFTLYRDLFSTGADVVSIKPSRGTRYGGFRKTSERAYPINGGVLVMEYNYQNATDPGFIPGND